MQDTLPDSNRLLGQRGSPNFTKSVGIKNVREDDLFDPPLRCGRQIGTDSKGAGQFGKE